MTNTSDAMRNIEMPCLSDEDLYNYLTKPEAEAEKASTATRHLASCSRCREELAGLLRILHPEQAETVAEQPSPQEIHEAVALINGITRRERSRSLWYKWGVAAAAALIVIGAGTFALLSLYVRSRSQAFYVQGLASLQKVYEPQSRSDLRIDLPFQSEATQRDSRNQEEIANAETLFNRAIGVRGDMREARLGLAYIHLRNNQFSRAESEFQALLNAPSNDSQALMGRGVSRFEAGIAATDPTLRLSGLNGALEDFEAVLKLAPQSVEARYDKARTLFELGQHELAVREIDAYLALDPDSLWAVKLRDLKLRLQMNRTGLLEKEVHRAALARDAPMLRTLAKVVPAQVAEMLPSILRKSLVVEGMTPPADAPGSSSLRWAAGILESAYRESTADASFSRLMEFYAGLSPPQRQLKKDLDAKLESIITAFSTNDIASALKSSQALDKEFETLHDYWQLARLHHLRGNSFFYGKSDFVAAEAEFSTMLEYAEVAGAIPLVATSLDSRSASLEAQGRFDEALSDLEKLEELSESHNNELWHASASMGLGAVYLRLNRLDESLGEYCAALKLAYRTMDPQTLIGSLQSLGVIMERMKRYPEARSYFQEAREWQDNFLKEGTLQAIVEVKVRGINLLFRQALLAIQMKDWPGAELLFKKALRDCGNEMGELKGEIHIGLAQTYLEMNRLQEAETEINKVQDRVSRDERTELAWKANSTEGLLLKQKGDLRSALGRFQIAARILEEMRMRISSEELRRSFLERRYYPFQQVVSLLYDSKSENTEALDFVDRAKSLTLREYIASYSHTDVDEGKLVYPWKDKAQFMALPSGMVTLEYFLSTDRVFIFVSDGRSVEAVALNLSLSELETQVRQYLDSIQNGDSKTLEALSNTLYQELMRPALARLELRKVDTLVILPDGALHTLPFGSLRDPEGRYLLEKYAIAFAPSRSILQYCLAMNKSSGFSSENSILLLDGTSNLPGAEAELANIAKIYGKNSRLLTPKDSASLEPVMGDYEIVHFAGHATLEQGRPRLVFHTPADETSVGFSDIEKWTLKKNRLVSLLGCNTGIGPIFDGESPWGLIPAFLNAGAPAILASLLPVDDRAAGKIAEEFYKTLARGGISKAEALRQAQLSFLQITGKGSYGQFLSWTPFVLVGDPR